MKDLHQLNPLLCSQSVEPIWKELADAKTLVTLPHLHSPLCSLERCVFVGELALVVVLGGRNMPTFPVVNMVNVSVYACAGWPNYPMSSKIFYCNYHSPP